MDVSVRLMVISGIEDGITIQCHTARGDGKISDDAWHLIIGRQAPADVRISGDSYISREHAILHWTNNTWWLEDRSRNGTFIPNPKNFFEDLRIKSMVAINEGDIFRVGRTWLYMEPNTG